MFGRLIRFLAIVLTFAVAVAPTSAWAAPAVGDFYKVTREVKSEDHSDDGSSGSSFDRDTVTIRVIAERAGGFELEYDMLPTASKEQREAVWQLPARLFVPVSGEPRLLNEAELTKRVDSWLALGGWTRAACGQWIFTWNAFKIECDPQSVIGIVKDFELQPRVLEAGAIYQYPGASAGAPLEMVGAPGGGARYSATMPVDGNQVRESLAQSDVVVAKISGRKLSETDAAAAHTATRITGTIGVTFEADSAGTVQKRTVVTKLKLVEVGGKTETRIRTETMTRSPLAP